MSQKHSIPVSLCTASFAKVVSGDTNRDNEIGNNDTSAEKNIHSNNMASLTDEQKVDSQEDWPSLEVVSNHQNEENDLAGHKCSIKMNKIGSNNDNLKKAKTAGTEEIAEKDKSTEETSTTAQNMVSPSGGSRKLQKNNWKKFDIKVDYNTAQEVFMSRRIKRETPDRRKEFEKGVAPPPPRRNHFVNNDRESKRQNKDFGFPPRNQQQQSRIETMNQRQQKQGNGKTQDEENGSFRKENMQKENPTAPDETKKNDKPQMEEDKPFSQSPDEQQNQQNNQQHDPAYWYFDGKSNGFYYQHSGSQGWKKNIPKERQQRNETDDEKSSRHSPNQNKPSNSINSETQIDQQSIKENNSVATKHQTSTVNHRNNTREAYANNGGGGYKNKKTVDSDQESQHNSNFAAPAKNNNIQWASTSGGMRSHQNGPRGGGQRQPFNATGVNDGGGHQRRSGANDYWRKNGNNEGIGANSNSMGLSNYPSKSKEDDRGGRSNQNQYHHRRNFNNNSDRDRWPRQHPNARSPLGMEQRGARGPLPDWDEVQEAGGEERFDYVDLMENQYSQCYGLAPIAPFDPSLGIMAADTTGTAAAFSTAALAPNYLQQMHLQNRLTLATFRPGYIVAAQPPTASLQAVTATQLSAQQEMTSRSDSNAFQHLAHTPMIQTLPPSIVTTATLPSAQTVPPTSLFSPNGMYPYSLAAVPANPIQGAAFVVTTDHPNHHQMPIPTTTTTPFPPAMLVPTHQFPSNQNVLFTPAGPPNQQFTPYFDNQLDEILRGQIEYYFSADNLQKDFYLRSRMDAEGFLPLDLIANFPRVRKRTLDRNFIIECLRNSEQIELSEDQQKLRPRNDPHQWPLESGAHPGTEISLAFDEEDGKYAPQPPEMQQQIVSKAIKSCLSDGEQGKKNIAGKVIMEKEQKGEEKMGRNSVESTERDDHSTKEGKESSSDSSMQNAEQQTKEEDNNWLEVKTKRNKKNNRGSGIAHKHMQN